MIQSMVVSFYSKHLHIIETIYNLNRLGIYSETYDHGSLGPNFLNFRSATLVLTSAGRCVCLTLGKIYGILRKGFG